MKPQLSVIFPTLNRADRLRVALSSVCEQRIDLRSIQVLVIDNGSTDETPLVVQEFASRIPDLSCFREPSPGLHAGRHRGLRESRSEILVFADDDISALPTWLATIHSSFGQSDLAMLGGNNLPDFEAPPPRWLESLWSRRRRRAGDRWIDALSILDLGTAVRQIDPLMVWGCNFAIRKSVLLDAGGFHPDAMPPDLLKFRGDGETHVARFVREGGLRCMFHPGATVYHHVSRGRMTEEYFRRRAFAQGISDSFTELRGRHLAAGSERNRPGLGERTIGAVRAGVGRILESVWGSGSDLGDMERERRRAYDAGYRYHQDCFEQDPAVREWVLKQSYLES
jgi:glycosyltransferase involved in cell wall biosynthesis